MREDFYDCQKLNKEVWEEEEEGDVIAFSVIAARGAGAVKGEESQRGELFLLPAE